MYLGILIRVLFSAAAAKTIEDNNSGEAFSILYGKLKERATMALVELLQQGWGVVQRGPPIAEPITPWVPAVRTKYSAAERDEVYTRWLQQYTQDHSDLPQTPVAFKEWALQQIAAEPPDRNVVTDYADIDTFIAKDWVRMMFGGGRRRRTYRKRRSTRGSRPRSGGQASLRPPAAALPR